MSYFGQLPLAALKPLTAGQNLSDLPNKATSRNNLDVFSKSETLLHTNPIGCIIAYWGSVAPAGYLPCHGQTINSATYPTLVEFLNPGQASATVPDLRGEFLRGWDSGRGVDSGRANLSAQADELKSHTHPLTAIVASATGSVQGNPAAWSGTTNYSSGPTGGTETRPRNVSVMYCIKAYGGINDSGVANMSGVLSLISTATQPVDFDNLRSANGYQKLPGGLIIQWGNMNQGSVVNGTTNIVFPIAFPNACLQAFAHDINGGLANVGSGGFLVSASAWTATAVEVQWYRVAGSTGGLANMNWFAIGY